MSTLPDTFWSTFISEYWEKKPVVFRDVLQEPPFTGSDLLESLKQSAETLVGGLDNPTHRVSPVRLYIDGLQAQYPQYMQFFPEGDSLDELFEIVSKRLEGKKFGIVLNDIQSSFGPALPRLQSFLRPLLAHVQIPASMIECAIFMGTYPYTPFGIHNDLGNDALTFTVHGRKRFLLWPPDYFASDPLGRFLEPDPAKYIHDAIDLEMGPRDLMYWPPNWYHVAYRTDVDTGPTATVSVGFWRNAVLSKTIADVVDEALASHLGASNNFSGTWASSPDLPPELGRAMQSLRTLVSSGELEARALAKWRRRVEASGFKLAPSSGPERPGQGNP